MVGVHHRNTTGQVRYFLAIHSLTNGIDIGRLATIPHGDSALGLGRSDVINGLAPIPGDVPTRPRVTAFPVGVGDNIENNPYLAPYKHFRDNRFTGVVNFPGFPGFNPLDTTELLREANQGLTVDRTTVLDFDTTLEKAGIANIPFIVKEANAASMKSTFWIQELGDLDENGQPKLRMQ